MSFSDHAQVSFVLCSFQPTKEKFVWDLWKFNSKLLNDDCFVNKVRRHLQDLASAKGEDFGVKWELFKQETKMAALERSIFLKHEEKKEARGLNELLQKLTREKCSFSGLFSDEIFSIKKRLEALDTEQYRGAVVRARWKQLSLGEIPTKRAIEAERKYASKDKVREIAYQKVLSRDTGIIERAFVEYYKDLFSYRAPKKDGLRRFYLPLMPKLTTDLKEKLE